MKLQAASKKEVRRMSVGIAICAVMELAGFFLLHLLGVMHFTLGVVIGTVAGAAVALLAFVVLCLSIQRAVETQDEKLRKRRMQMSYQLRLLMQAGWVVAAFLLDGVQVLAAAVPLLFPTVIIFYLQWHGKLTEPSERKNPDLPQDDEEDHLGSFEI